MSLPIQIGTVYGNCKMLAPDGTLLCRCHYDKVEWYVSRGLAEIVEQEPNITIQLNFEPKGMGNAGEPFYMQEKENRCVVCGAEEDLTKHHCVPACFRKCMPDEYKMNTSHDVLPVCVACHMEYEPAAQQLKEDIAKRFGIAFHPQVAKDDTEWKAWKSANALLRYREQIPESRIGELTQVLRDFLGKEDVTQEDLEALGDRNPYKKFVGINGHSQTIMDQIADLDEFIREWRQHFLDTMQPKFMPEHWSVDFHTKKPD